MREIVTGAPCDRPPVWLNLMRRLNVANNTCSIDGCWQAVRARGWCNKHYLRWSRYGSTEINLRPELSMSVEQRFWIKVNKDGPIPVCRSDLGPCWVWTGKLSTGARGGYGHLRIGNSNPPAHRVAYELLVGPIPAGLVIDHLCRNRACVNPAHLEPVTNRENLLRGVGAPASHARKTHCIHNHEFTPENTRLGLNGRRQCRTCETTRWGPQRRLRRLQIKRSTSNDNTQMVI